MNKNMLANIALVLLIALPVLAPLMLNGAGLWHAAAISLEGLGEDPMSILDEALAKASPETQACIECHLRTTPGIVFDWLKSEHAWNTPEALNELYAKLGEEAVIASKFKNYPYTVGCYECHGMFKEQNRPDVISNHFGYSIVTIVSLKDCSQCHYKEAEEITWTWHGFAALNGPLKPWYSKIVKYAKENNRLDMLPPVYENTGVSLVDWPWYMDYARKLLENPSDPEVQQFGTIYDYDFKDIVSPLYPVSGVFNATGLMQNENIKNAYIYFACMQCHGSLVVPYKAEAGKVEFWGWPNNGAGRVNPDGSIGTCTACHTRHVFSVEEARKPYTCGQCHLGYDHPHIEIYEESKHGNIYDSEGETWNWSSIPWRVGVDFRAPTCATCHMSTIADAEGKIIVKGSHDLRERLVWDQMHFFSFPKPKWPDNTQNAIIKGGSQLTGKGLLENKVAFEGYKVRVEEAPAAGEIAFPRLAEISYTGDLLKHRNNMKAVCKLCHTSQWVDKFFMIFDQNIVEYNITAQYAYSLLQKAYEEGIHDPKNKLDEFMELMWYYIWHHDGRRWRNGAAMLGPDFTFWYGAVDTVMDKLGRMISYYNTAVELKTLKEQLETLKATGASAEQVAQLESKIASLESKLSAMEAEIPKLSSDIQDLQSNLENVSATAEEAAAKSGRATPALALAIIGVILAVISLGLAFRRT